MKETEEKLVISLNKARKMLDTNYNTIYKLIMQKQVETIKLLGKKKVIYKSLLDFIERNKTRENGIGKFIETLPDGRRTD